MNLPMIAAVERMLRKPVNDPLRDITFLHRYQTTNPRNANDWCFTDTGGSTPAAVELDSVAAIADYATGSLLTQATSGSRPKIRRLYDRPRILFDGLDDRFSLTESGLQGAGSFFVALVLSYDTSAVILKSGRWFLTLRDSTNLAITSAGAVLCSYDISALRGQNIVIEAKIDYANGAVDGASATGTLYINGSQVATGTSSTVPAQSNTSWGANVDGSDPYGGEMLSAYVIPGTISTDERTLITGYLQTLFDDTSGVQPDSIAGLEFAVWRGRDIWNSLTAGTVPAHLGNARRWGPLTAPDLSGGQLHYPCYQATTGKVTSNTWQAGSSGEYLLPTLTAQSDDFTFGCIVEIPHLGRPGAGYAGTDLGLKARRTIISSSDGMFRVYLQRWGKVCVEYDGNVEVTTLRVPCSKSWVAIRTGATPTLYVNGQSYALTGDYSTAEPLTGGYLFAVPSADGYHPLQAAVSNAVMYDHALTDLEMGRLLTFAKQKGIVWSPSYNVEIRGDSIASYNNADPVHGWVHQVRFKANTLLWNMSEPGITALEQKDFIIGSEPPLYRAGIPNLFINACGRNDLPTKTGFEIFGYSATMAATVRAAGFDRILHTSITPAVTDDAGKTVERLFYTSLLQGSPIETEGTANWDTVATLADPANFGDGLHPDDPEHTLMRDVIEYNGILLAEFGA